MALLNSRDIHNTMQINEYQNDLLSSFLKYSFFYCSLEMLFLLLPLANPYRPELCSFWIVFKSNRIKFALFIDYFYPTCLRSRK